MSRAKFGLGNLAGYTAAPQPYGWRVTWERINPRTGRVEKIVSGCKGTNAHARQSAVLKSNFIRLLKLEPLDQEIYDQEFPAGQTGRVGRFVSVTARA